MEQKEAYVSHWVKVAVLHAGSENGWINGADIVFQSKKSPRSDDISALLTMVALFIDTKHISQVFNCNR